MRVTSSTLANPQAAKMAACMLAAEPVPACRTPLIEQAVTGLSDDAREDAIRRAGKALQLHMEAHETLSAVHAATGCFADQGEADRQLRMAHEAKRLMVTLIQGRSREQVRRLEIKAGLI